MASRSPTAIVVGGGVFGLTGALELRRRGWDVSLLDSEPLPAPRASSTDISKMIRMDYGSDRFTTALAELALAGWDAWNALWDRPLFHQDGFLLLSGDSMVPGGFEHDSRETLEERGYDLESVDATLLESRFPAWNASRYRDGYFNPRAGWAESGEVVARLAREARRAGVRVRESAVRSVGETRGRGMEVVTDEGRALRAQAVVVAAGAWSAELVPSLRGSMRTVGQPVLHFQVESPAKWKPPTFVPWAADIARTGWYGFPADSHGILKIGHHGAGLEPATEGAGQVPPHHVERCRAFLRRSLPSLAARPLAGSRICHYCDTFDGDFWIGQDPDRPGLTVAAGGSGHGFKFAPVLGPLIADAVEGRTNRWGGRFGWRAPGTQRTEHARFAGEDDTPEADTMGAADEAGSRGTESVEQTSLEL